MTRLSHLNSLQALEAAIRQGSLKAAAEELGISGAAVGQRIKALEDYLGVQLLFRGHGVLTPTPALAIALGDLGEGFRRLDMVAELLRMPGQNRVLVAGDEDWLELWLKPRLSEFKREYPELEIVIAAHTCDPSEIDVRVDFSGSGNGSLLFRDYLLPVISPTNYARIAAVPMASRLEGFPLLHVECYGQDDSALNWPDWVSQFGHRQIGADRGVRYTRVAHALKGVRSNAGALLCGLSLVINAVREGDLMLPFPLEEGQWSNFGYRAVFRSSVKERRAVGLFREWLLVTASENRDDLETFLNEQISQGAVT